MKYYDLSSALDAYKNGKNVTQRLKELIGVEENTPEIIEIAYDLQSGSYIDFVNENKSIWNAYVTEIAKILGQYIVPGDRVLDVGTGELTTLSGVANQCFSSVKGIYACDISWSRIYRGRQFFQEIVKNSLVEQFHPFVADLFSLPLADGAVDVLWTSHALEPNGGRERQALAELFRVTRRKLVLFEPSYEENSKEGRVRMEHHGYVKGLPAAIEELGGHCDAIIPLATTINRLNPTHAYVITPPEKSIENFFWACPATRLPMVRLDDCFWCEKSLLAYTTLKGIPILRQESAILASGLK